MSVTLPETPAEAPAYPADVQDYIRRHDLAAAVRETERLAGELLPPGSGVTWTVEGDGESDFEWLIARLAIQTPMEELYPHLERYIKAWAESVPLDAQDYIRLSYDAR